MNRAEFIARAVLATIGTPRERQAAGTAEVLWGEYQKALIATGGIPAEVPPPAPRLRGTRLTPPNAEERKFQPGGELAPEPPAPEPPAPIHVHNHSRPGLGLGLVIGAVAGAIAAE